jgi:hypothetical protein
MGRRRSRCQPTCLVASAAGLGRGEGGAMMTGATGQYVINSAWKVGSTRQQRACGGTPGVGAMHHCALRYSSCTVEPGPAAPALAGGMAASGAGAESSLGAGAAAGWPSLSVELDGQDVRCAAAGAARGESAMQVSSDDWLVSCRGLLPPAASLPAEAALTAPAAGCCCGCCCCFGGSWWASASASSIGCAGGRGTPLGCCCCTGSCC